MTHWYALRIRPQQDAYVVKAMGEKGLTVYSPRHIDEARFARRVATRSRPLLPGYVLAELPGDDAHQAALGIAGVLRGSRFLPIPSLAVASLILAEAAHKFDETWKPRRAKARRFKPGDRVRIVSGHLYDRTAEVVRAKNGDRLDVVLRIFGRDHEVEMRHAQLVATQDIAA